MLHCRVIDDDDDDDVAPNNNKPGGDGGRAEKLNKDNDNKNMVIEVELQLDVTTMHPQGGGQPTDVGSITVVGKNDGGMIAEDSPRTVATIHKVTIDRTTGIVTHAGTISASSSSTLAVMTSDHANLFPMNSCVKVCVDPTNRLLLSECHTAGHVVDAAMARCGKLLPPTKGYHFLDGPYVEYKGSIDGNERGEFLSRLQCAYRVSTRGSLSIHGTLPYNSSLLCIQLCQITSCRN